MPMDEILKLERRQWRYALAALLVAVVCVFAGVTMNLTTIFDENFDHMGIRYAVFLPHNVASV